MKKQVSLFGLIFAVAFVAMVSSWLNSIEVNATSVSDYLKSIGYSVSERIRSICEPVHETVILDNMVPLADAPKISVIGIEEAPRDVPAVDDVYLTELESTQQALKETQEKLAEMQTEIELLKSTFNGTSDADKDSENEETEEENDTDIEGNAKIDAEPANKVAQTSQPIVSGEESPKEPELTEPQIWQKQFAAYQEWAKQYVMK